MFAARNVVAMSAAELAPVSNPVEKIGTMRAILMTLTIAVPAIPSEEAETMTDRLCAQTLAQALDESKFSAFEAAVSTLRAATP